MSNRDPIFSKFSALENKPRLPCGKQLDPNAGHFVPTDTLSQDVDKNNIKSLQASAQSHVPVLQDRIVSLEQSQTALRNEVKILQMNQAELVREVNALGQGGGSSEVGLFQVKDEQEKVASPNASLTLPPHLRRAAASRVINGVKNGLNHDANNGIKEVSATNGLSKGSASHVNGTNNALTTDGKVDMQRVTTVPASVTVTPGPSSITTRLSHDQPIQSIEEPYVAQSGKGWMPIAVGNFRQLDRATLSKIPPVGEMISFSYDFLINQFGGHQWSPGLNCVPPSSHPCLLPNRTYYVLDAKTEPYLPKEPGQHGAKLTAFFNKNPEETYDVEDCGNSFENVPLFVCNTPWAVGTKHARYMYFGNYSQTRWSDKLDYDRMVDCVPAHVKAYWAEELSANGRAEWVTEALMEHFFPRPVYDGRLPAVNNKDNFAAGDATKLEEKALKDMKRYMKALAEWQKDAELKVKSMNKEFILKAFESADADDPKGLRLWWEYLQCVDWDSHFYHVITALQSRNRNYH